MTDLTPEQQLFLASDAALREVIDQFTPATLALAVPAEWSSNKTTTMTGTITAAERSDFRHPKRDIMNASRPARSPRNPPRD